MRAGFLICVIAVAFASGAVRTGSAPGGQGSSASVAGRSGQVGPGIRSLDAEKQMRVSRPGDASLSGAAAADGGAGSGQSGAAIRAPLTIRGAADFKQTLLGRYAVEESDVSLEDRPEGGVEGHFQMRGDLTPGSARAPQIVQAGPRAIAQMFIAAEAASLGIAATDDLRESVYSQTTTGWTGITYHRFVGDLQLENAQVSFSVDPEGTIRSVSGYLVPLPSALFHAAAQPTIPEASAHGIIRNHLREAGADPKAAYRLRRVATSSAPYVIWKSSGTWVFRIDAFTGEILEKRYGLQSVE